MPPELAQQFQQRLEQTGVASNTPSFGGDLLTDKQAVRTAFNIRPPSAQAADNTLLFTGTDKALGKPHAKFIHMLDQKDVAAEDGLRTATLKALEALNYKEAEKQGLELLALRKKMYGDKSPQTGESTNLLGFAAEKDGRFADAKDYYKQGVDICTSVYGKDSFYTGMQIQNVAHMDGMLGNWSDAATNYKEAIRIYEKNDPMKSAVVGRETMLTLGDYAQVLDRLHDQPGAAAQRQRRDEIQNFWKQKAAAAEREIVV
jgi:tetratricopeptide (TPR) repeat protein